ncbi:hypothetical protein PVAND_003268 [Polypedilum vanderplanki]|uniref:Uncharacterized protein n=1 Tax=Polypedilum vanderplanki TaxID=319348 RepID=A0A9J6BTJ1_POLVA|nr:hypothetical protein PVAND_003268 [Polypedilum vanderplanki]
MFCYILLIILFSSTSTASVNFVHLFEAILDRFEIVTENTDIWEWHFKVRKVNKTRSIVGYTEVKIPIGNDYKVEMKVLKKQGKYENH